jgi:hypothetical protein
MVSNTRSNQTRGVSVSTSATPHAHHHGSVSALLRPGFVCVMGEPCLLGRGKAGRDTIRWMIGLLLVSGTAALKAPSCSYREPSHDEHPRPDRQDPFPNLPAPGRNAHPHFSSILFAFPALPACLPSNALHSDGNLLLFATGTPAVAPPSGASPSPQYFSP